MNRFGGAVPLPPSGPGGYRENSRCVRGTPFLGSENTTERCVSREDARDTLAGESAS